MGIKGIYGEIGPGERVALAKLAVEKFEQTGRPLRIAIDVSIWEFQVQSGQGGANPALRTLYYRLLRLAVLSIQPLFVFDGPKKPPLKRNKRTGPNCASIPNYITKQLLKLFGFPTHNAPGEAEAECALLQREGIVDAVLSEDVDTLMFGSGITFRNWSSEDSRGKTPTHVSVYDARATKEGKSGLDREGMVLVALMSGGDYITEGIPGCGIKLACDVARAGFGKSLCSISRKDVAAIAKWRTELAHEIRTNESGHLRMKRKTLRIPEDFPSLEVLGYYTHPVVSTAAIITRLKTEIAWEGVIDIMGLRTFVAEAFGWTHKTGAKKFIHGLAPALLVSKLRLRGNRRDSGFDDIVYTAINEMELVRAVCGRRVHFSTGGIPELRLLYHPLDIVGLDLDIEKEHSDEYARDGLATSGIHESGDESEEKESTGDTYQAGRSMSPLKRKSPTYDPSKLNKIWVSASIAKVGIPLKVEDWEDAQRNPRKVTRAEAVSKRPTTNGGMPRGALDRYLTINKPGVDLQERPVPEIPRKVALAKPDLSPLPLAPSLESLTRSKYRIKPRTSGPLHVPPRDRPDVHSKKVVKGTPSKSISHHEPTSRNGQRENIGTAKNPWAIAESSSPSTPRTMQISKPGLHGIAKESFYPPSANLWSSEVTKDQKSSLSSSPQFYGMHTQSSSPIISDMPGKDNELSSNSEAEIRPLLPQKKHSPVSVTDQLPCVSNRYPPISINTTPRSLDSRRVQNKLESVLATDLQIGGDDRLARGKEKKLFVLRESLEGAWKEIHEDDWDPTSGRGKTWRESQVEILDLTGE